MVIPEAVLTTYWHLASRLLIAFVIGGAIGFERELHGRPAGLRTHMLVCLGACLMTVVDAQLSDKTQGRIAAQIVTGVGFLGAGTILRSNSGDNVHGLTTAASLWCVAGMGIAVGYGGVEIWLAVTTAAIVLLTLTLINTLEKVAIHHRKERSVVIFLQSPDEASASNASSKVINSFASLGVKVRSVRTDNVDDNPRKKVVHFDLKIPDDVTSDQVILALSGNAEITQCDWES